MSGIPDPCELTFFVEDAEPIIQEIFANRSARTLWLGIKAGHIVSQQFNQNCLDLGKWIDETIEETPVDGRWLTTTLQNLSMIGSAEKFGNTLAPYLNGEKEINWIEVAA